MNSYIEAQITNVIAVVKTFERSCEMAAIKDDGRIDKAEQKKLKKISAATNRFIKQIEKLK